jgi:rubrerythrin
VDYIVNTVDREFFQPGAPIRGIPDGATLDEMLGQAIAFEQQTLLFFYTLRDLTQAANRDIIDHIIVEEKSHIRKLASMRAIQGR